MKSTSITDLEILNSARLGTEDYEFDPNKVIKEGEKPILFEVKSKVDNKFYTAKRLQYQIGSKDKTSELQTAAEQEIAIMRRINHPTIMGIVDIVKD